MSHRNQSSEPDRQGSEPILQSARLGWIVDPRWDFSHLWDGNEQPMMASDQPTAVIAPAVESSATEPRYPVKGDAASRDPSRLNTAAPTDAEMARRRVKEAMMEDLREAVEGPVRVQALRRLAQERGQPIDDLVQALSGGEPIEAGLKAFVEGKFYESAELFGDIARAREERNLPSAAEAYLFRGNALICLGHHTEAVKSLSKCLALGLASAITWNNHGVALMGTGGIIEATASFDRAIEMRKDYALAWCHRGRTYALRAEHEVALDHYKMALRFNPSYYRTWYNRGRSLTVLRRFEEALENYETATQIYARDPALWYARGNTLFRLQRFEEAIASYDRTLALDPTHYFALTNRGVALALVGWEEAALGSFERALEVDPSYGRAWYNRGVVFQRLGDVSAARASIERFLACAPRHSPMRESASDLLQQLKLSPAT